MLATKSVFTAPDTEKLFVRTLTPSDCAAFRALRLEALSGQDAKNFGASYEEEKNQTLAEWRKRCTETNDQAIFGLFVRGQLIGNLAATKWDSDTTGETLLWGSAYVKKEYRGKRFAGELYKMRLEWSLSHRQFEKAVLFIRAGNATATRIHTKNGAQYIYSAPMRCADGNKAIVHWYERPLVDCNGMRLEGQMVPGDGIIQKRQALELAY